MFLLVAIIFYAIVFMRLFYFQFLCCFIDEGAVKLEEGTDVVAPVRRGFLLFFIFYYFYFIGHFVAYAGVWSEGNMFFSWQDYARIMQETCQEPKEAVVTKDGVSISITERHHHRSKHRRTRQTRKRDTQIQKMHT